mmetsp:Transcript_72139/g.227633  ORF Transcript_72139/g.227633 Transcript_72139/m.227633 type:complete len:134 (-) Transcript_72139:88-489(-)
MGDGEGVPGWDQDLRDLLESGTINGFALLTAQGTLVEEAQGELAEGLSDGEACKQFLRVFVPGSFPHAFQVLGDKMFVFHHGASSAYGVSRGKRRGICVHNLACGVLVTIYSKPNFAYSVVPAVERALDKLRS